MRSQFADAQRLLVDALASDPPAELPGCVSCPARCRFLPIVEPHLPTLRASIAVKAVAPIPIDERVSAVRSIAESNVALLRGKDEAFRDAFVYCLVTNAARASAPLADEVLERLRGDPQPPAGLRS
jgi:hypothetical protein